MENKVRHLLTQITALENELRTVLHEQETRLFYQIDGKRVERWPASGAELARATPIYEHFEGWSEPISGARRMNDLPGAAQRYVAALEEAAGAPIDIIFPREGLGYDPVGELRRGRHSLQGAFAHRYDATSRIHHNRVARNPRC